jgi:hypothetical protein
MPGPVVAPGGTLREAPARMPIGMDDPSIASQLAPAGLAGAGAAGRAMTYRIESAEVGDEGPQVPVGDHEPAAVEPAPPEGVRAPREGAGAILGTFLAAVGGAAAGWWVAPRLAEIGEPRTWILVGTTVGLLVAWLGLRWTREKP